MFDVGTGTASGSASGAGIVGAWRRLFVVRTQTDIITSETTWIFSPGGGCERTIVTSSVAQGVPSTERAGCSYLLASGRVTVQFSSGGPVQFTLATSGNRLFLGGVEFTRVG